MLYPDRKYTPPTVTFTVVDGVSQEVVSLQQAKDFLKVDYDDENGLIELLISSAREEIEVFTGLSIGVRKIRLIGDHQNSDVYMPFEPVTSLVGDLQTVGYTSATVPAAIKKAILRMVHTHFEFRNDIEKSGMAMLDINWQNILKPFRRRVGI